MKLSQRIKEVPSSITLQLNSKAVAMAEEGKKVFNLTAGQLPFKPHPNFVELLRSELNFMKSFRYCPVAGFPNLRKKLMNRVSQSRNIEFPEDFDCFISNGGKHSISTLLGGMVDKGDEVILLAPYWVSYPVMVEFCHGIPVTVESTVHDNYTPSISDIKKSISEKTKVIIINSPNNPGGIHYSEEWMKELAELLVENPHINIISDEIYFDLSYFDPKPKYFYQFNPELLDRTVIVDGISKSLACTGLRLGYAIGPGNLISACTRLQGQLTSGSNSHVQRALANFDFNDLEEYLTPIKTHLRSNSRILMECLRDSDLSHCWYQSMSAFYFLFDFTHTPFYKSLKKSESDHSDYSMEICTKVLDDIGVAMVPGVAFGVPNSARISLVSERAEFTEAIELLCKYLKGPV